MAPPAWAFHVENFVHPPDDELICSICQSVFNDPVRTPCQHVFCKNCILSWLINSKHCPFCRHDLHESQLEHVVLLIKNLLQKQKIRCHNSDRGCKDIISLEQCESHANECPYELVTCKNTPCRQTIIRKHRVAHETRNCHFSRLLCAKCRLSVLRMYSNQHNCFDSLKKELEAARHCLKEKDVAIKLLQDELNFAKERNEEFAQAALAGQAAAAEESEGEEVGERIATILDQLQGTLSQVHGTLERLDIPQYVTRFLETHGLEINSTDGSTLGYVRVRNRPRTSRDEARNQPTSQESVMRELQEITEQVNGQQTRRFTSRRMSDLASYPSSAQRPQITAVRSLSRPVMISSSYGGVFSDNATATDLSSAPIDCSAGSTSRGNLNESSSGFVALGSVPGSDANVPTASSYVPAETVSYPGYGLVSNYLQTSNSGMSVYGRSSMGCNTSYVYTASRGSSGSINGQDLSRSSTSSFREPSIPQSSSACSGSNASNNNHCPPGSSAGHGSNNDRIPNGSNNSLGPPTSSNNINETESDGNL